MAKRLGKASQENLLALLATSEKQAGIIRNTIKPELFIGHYADMMETLCDYYDTYGKPPGFVHLADLFENELNHSDEDIAEQYRDTILNVEQSHKDINEEYVMSSLQNFIRTQVTMQAVLESAELLASMGSDAIDDVDEILAKAQKTKLDLFEPGIRLIDTTRSLSFLDKLDEELEFPTGIPEFDKYQVCPARQTLFVFVALPKRGKTQFAVNLGRQSLLNRKKVLHISLEMSAEAIAQRYVQNLFAVAKRKEDISITRLEVKKGKLVDMLPVDRTPQHTFEDDNIKSKLLKKIDQVGYRIKNIIVKGFPSGKLTIKGLNAYLDNLEQREGFIPDLIILDYADIMEVPSDNKRDALGKLYVDLRGLGQERNAAVVTFSQGNRQGVGRKEMTESNIAEDFSKMATADIVVIYNQTKMEKMLGLARVTVQLARGDQDSFTVLVSQNYTQSQFVVDSVRLSSNYFDMLKELSDEPDDEED